MTGFSLENKVFETALQERQPVACRLLSAALNRRALSNAYLLTGRANADKSLISIQLAAFLNCLKRNEAEFYSCLATGLQSPCQNCNWIKNMEHPQALLKLEGQGESGKIAVEKARLLVDELKKTSQYCRVVIVPEAGQEVLHSAPANALLKSIEEAQNNTLFILFAAASQQVLSTIVSRCQLIPIQNKFKPGLWIEEGLLSRQTTLSSEHIMAMKSELMHISKNRLSGNYSHSSSFLKAASESQDLFTKLLSTSDDDSLDPAFLLDIFLCAELELLKERSLKNPDLSLYLKKLIELVEASKQELNHYVRKANVLETFSYSLTKLRLKYLGDFHLAK